MGKAIERRIVWTCDLCQEQTTIPLPSDGSDMVAPPPGWEAQEVPHDTVAVCNTCLTRVRQALECDVDLKDLLLGDDSSIPFDHKKVIATIIGQVCEEWFHGKL